MTDEAKPEGWEKLLNIEVDPNAGNDFYLFADPAGEGMPAFAVTRPQIRLDGVKFWEFETGWTSEFDTIDFKIRHNFALTWRGELVTYVEHYRRLVYVSENTLACMPLFSRLWWKWMVRTAKYQMLLAHWEYRDPGRIHHTEPPASRMAVLTAGMV